MEKNYKDTDTHKQSSLSLPFAEASIKSNFIPYKYSIKLFIDIYNLEYLIEQEIYLSKKFTNYSDIIKLNYTNNNNNNYHIKNLNYKKYDFIADDYNYEFDENLNEIQNTQNPQNLKKPKFFFEKDLIKLKNFLKKNKKN